MSWRYQLPVSSQASLSALFRALPHVISPSDEPRVAFADRLRSDLGADAAILTQSGTAALVLAIRQTVAEGGTVALPAYGCADLVAAAIRARVRVRLYDIDRTSLSPDLESLAHTLSRHVDAVVVAHLFGVPADVHAVQAIADQHGAAVIEDAAQGLGSVLDGTAGGALAHRSVLSFGRGKGVSGGAGGALLMRGQAAQNEIDAALEGLLRADRGMAPFIMTAVQRVVGRPSLYRLPASIPFLRLGEMVYKDAPEPAAMPATCAVLAMESWRTLPRRVGGQHAIAAAYAAMVSPDCAIHPTAGALPSYLRFPVLINATAAIPRELGIQRGYPAALNEQRHIHQVLCAHEPDMPGAKALQDELTTLPTHTYVSDADILRITRWLESP